ncbi:MAG: toprim domain-containing protein [Nanopusillaceae archaeon]
MHSLIAERKINKWTLQEFDIAEYDGEKFFFYGREWNVKDNKIGVYFPHFSFGNDFLGYSVRKIDETNGKWFHSYGFSKNSYLYGFVKTINYIRELQKVIVVEGLFDLLRLYQAGIKNVVSCFGITFTWNHFYLLYPFVDEIIFIPDGDEGGKKMIEKVREFSSFVNIKIINLPDKLDPDDYINKRGVSSFLKLIKEGK